MTSGSDIPPADGGTRRPPADRPPWWPQEEPWPPESPAPWGRPGHRGGWSKVSWSRRGKWDHRPRFWRPFGCLIVLAGLFVGGTIVVALWTIAAILGLVTAHPLVVALGIVALGVVAVAAFGAVRAVRRMSAPVDDLIEAAGRIELGDYSVRVAERGPRGVRSLTRAFDAMAERLEVTDARRRSFLADVAHELRTPLSVIQGQLEAIADGVYPADEAHLAPVIEQVRTLDRLVDDLRTVALAEAGALQLAREHVDLGTLVEDVIGAQRTMHDQVELVTEIEPGPPSIEVDPSRIRQVLSNLLANAIRHTPPGGRVTVTVGPAGTDQVAVAVRDTGAGIPPALLPRIFDRFAKGPDSTGTGLGLAIARDLVEAHGGAISAESTPGEGATIRFTLPRRRVPD